MMKIYVLVESRSEGNDVPPAPTIEVFSSRELLVAFLKDNYELTEEEMIFNADGEDWTEDENGVWQPIDILDEEPDGAFEKRLTLQTFDV